jgi:hypothetical protein
VRVVTSRLRKRVIHARIADWPRILPTWHRATPADAGFGSSRFSSPSGAFKVLYAADNFPTAFAEAVIRDRFEGKTLPLSASPGTAVRDRHQLKP